MRDTISADGDPEARLSHEETRAAAACGRGRGDEVTMSEKREYYEVLGVRRDATDEDIRRAFRRLARQYHPDVNKDPDAEARFKEVNEAYEVLSDPEKRERYDAFGHAGLDGIAAPDFAAGFGAFTDLFESFFGTDLRRERRGPARGADLRVELEIDLLEAVHGTEKKVRVPREQLCSRCHGERAEPGTARASCRTCGGTGEVRTVRSSLFGRIVNVATCPSCGGEGEIITTPCTQCGGTGRERVVRELSISVPAGIDDGQQLRVSGEGEAGTRGGPPGSLYVLVRVRPHPLFERRGQDLRYELRLSPALAVLGGEVEVPTVDGPERVRIPPGTQHGELLRLRGKGVPRLGGGGRGDQIVLTRILLPTKLSSRERKLWQELRSASAEPERRAEEKSFLERLKDVLGG